MAILCFIQTDSLQKLPLCKKLEHNIWTWLKIYIYTMLIYIFIFLFMY